MNTGRDENVHFLANLDDDDDDDEVRIRYFWTSASMLDFSLIIDTRIAKFTYHLPEILLKVMSIIGFFT